MQFISSVYLVQNVQIEFLYTNTRPAASEGISSFICETRSEAKHFIKCIWGGIHNSFLTSPVMKKKKKHSVFSGLQEKVEITTKHQERTML